MILFPDVLVVNQNYDKNWKTFPPKMVKSHEGLISVEIDPSDRGIILYYLPYSFVFGVFSFFIGVLGWIVFNKTGLEWQADQGGRGRGLGEELTS